MHCKTFPIYVVAIEKGDKKHTYKEAILLHLEGLMDEKKSAPAPKPLEAHQKNRKYKGWTWAVIEVDLAELDDKTERINITLPRKVLRVIDEAAKRSGESRSGYLARVGIESVRRAG